MEDADGSPTAIVWITAYMRKAWIRYGDVIFLDAMKRKLNSLHWPYIGPVVLDHEMRVIPAVECLCLEEANEFYAFALNSLFEMEPKRSKDSLRLIFGDCKITKELLPMVGIPKGQHCWVVWDSFHLTSKVWPEELGKVLYNRIR